MIRLIIILSIGLNATQIYAADSLQCSGSYSKDSVKNGIWLCRKGNMILRKERYVKGILSTYIIYNEKGQIIETRNKRGKVKTYKPCGC